MSQVAAEATLAEPARRRAAPVALSTASAVFQVAPSGETLSVQSSSPISPSSALPEKPLCMSSESTSPAPSLFKRAAQVAVAALGERQRGPKSAVLSLAAKGLVPSAVVPIPSRERFWSTPMASAASCQEATCPSRPVQTPDAAVATMWRSPSAGDAGGAERSRSTTARCTRASSSRNASLWVTCFCACDGIR